jgi:HK97 family phage portal protein
MLNRLKTLLQRDGARLAPEAKRFAAAPVVAIHAVGRPQWTPRNYAALAREGFAGNAIGYRCVRMLSEAAASIPLLVYDGASELAEHPLRTLLNRPNPLQTGRELIENIVSFLLVAGNSYIESSSLDGIARELVVLRPDRMKVIAGNTGWPEAYEYSVGGQSSRVAADSILHIKLFNPLDDYYGMSPLEAAQRSIDTHNAASAWNKAMLDNAARPSGALVFAAADGHLTTEQFERIKAELEANYQGAMNAGRPMVLEGGLDWKEMGYSPKDMEFIEAKNAAAREVALAFGVPPMLLGIPGDNTFANYAEANRTFWRQAVVPLLGRVTEALSNWLAPQFGPALTIGYDLDQVEALSLDRDALWARVDKASFLTPDEKREAVGYGPLA